jgi:two-component system, OmpR family, response regulator
LKTLLIVEDEPLILKILQEILSKNYTLFLAGDYDIAIKHIKKEIIDLCLVDYTIPCNNGLILINYIKDIKDIPCILMSGHSKEIIMSENDEMYIDYFLQKPIDFKSLTKIITVLIDWNQK